MNLYKKIEELIPDEYTHIIITTDNISRGLSEEIYNILFSRLDSGNRKTYNNLKEHIPNEELIEMYSGDTPYCILLEEPYCAIKLIDRGVFNTGVPMKLIETSDLMLLINNHKIKSIKNRYVGLKEENVDLSIYMRSFKLERILSIIKDKQKHEF